ncbi:MAG: transposase [Leptolyngbyaceae cyanobacterium RM2_2_4]|nr:transposase [Leptolyngbyaceae cyanobacterium RM2_2_4]
MVEGTWTWLEDARILNRDYERLPENHEGMIYVIDATKNRQKQAKVEGRNHLTSVCKQFLIFRIHLPYNHNVFSKS